MSKTQNGGTCNLYSCTEFGCPGHGISNSTRTMYDNCATSKRIYESVEPLSYMLFEGKFENCDKCMINNQFYRPFDLTDIESELKNITRPVSRCPQFKYNPNCKKSKSCVSTFDASVPKTPSPDLCPIVFNNLPRFSGPMYDVPRDDFCGKAKKFTVA